jgi:hypothetical protein
MQEQTITVGMKVKLDGKTYTVGYAGKEIRLDGAKGEQVWRHSRTVQRLLEEQAKKPAATRKPRARKTAKKLEDTLAAAAADAAARDAEAAELAHA